MGYVLKGAGVYGTDGKFHNSEVYISDGEFTASLPEGDCETLDLTGLKLIPGLTDIHFHGCRGRDFCEDGDDVIQLIADYEEANGITTICPATMTFPEDKLTRIMRAAAAFPNERGAALVGINMEGPFISYGKRGAQNPKYIQKPDAAMFRRLQEASGGLIKLVPLAPEVEGAFDFIDSVKDEVMLSLAHTTADYDTASEAFKRGIGHVTHLYNGMKDISHRKPGPVLAAADTDSVEVELICDNVHNHPAVVRNTLRMFREDRVIFISDSMEAAGMEDGEYELGGLPVKKAGKVATLNDGTIAGGAANLMECLKTAVLEMGISLETAVKCAAINPARSIGIFGRYGSIEEGKCANLVCLDKDLNVRLVFNRGRLVVDKR